MTGEKLRPAADPREALQSRAAAGDYSAALRGFAVELGRIANDLRLLASGPVTGFDEIRLPAVQPGSSIMPGKVNPAILECLNMLCFQVVGFDTANMLAVGGGQLDLNVMMPLLAYNLTKGPQLFVNFLPVVTALTPRIGYAPAAEVFKEAVSRGVRVKQVLLEKKILTEEELAAAMTPEALLGPLE
jgi:aspartate ammonia-lyase